MKQPNASKDTLPSGAQYLDRGGLTFMQPSLLPWLHAVEESMKIYLNQDGYKKYGKDIFSVSRAVQFAYYVYYIQFLQITKESVVKDCTLLVKFREAVQNLQPSIHEDVLKQVHGVLLSKIYKMQWICTGHH